MKKKALLVLLLALTMTLSGCGSKKETAGNENTENAGITADSSAAADEEMFTERDMDVSYDAQKAAYIELDGNSAKCDSDAVQIDGSTITIIDEGTYIISGELSDGMIIVNAEENDKPKLVLDNAKINSETSASLYILEADKVVVTLAEGSENTLSNGGTFTAIDDNNIDAAVFSKQDLSLNGNGTLTVTSPAGHGIVCKDDLVLTSGNYTVTSASKGLDANDSVRIVNASVNVDAGKDGIHAENADDTELGFVYIESGTFNIDAEGDGISAGAFMQIVDGSFDIVTGGGSVNASQQTSSSWGGFMGGPREMEQSQTEEATEDDSSTSIKALKAAADLTIIGGDFVIDSADDSIHSNTAVTVNGGTFEIASGDDAFHADETLLITEGTINVTQSYEGLEGLDIEISGGDMKLVCNDDGINAAGGTDSSGFGGVRTQDQFGRGGGPGEMGDGQGEMGGGASSSSNGSILISGGTIYMNASGDGIDANGSLEITGGDTVVCGPTQGDTAVLDYDTTATITGGTFIGTGSTMMAQTFTESEQGVFAVTVGSQKAGTQILLEDAEGNVVFDYTPELDYQIVILSSPDLVSGDTYKITVGEATGEFQAN